MASRALCYHNSPGPAGEPHGSTVSGFPPTQVLQGLHIGILCHVPDLDAAVVGGTVELVRALPEGQALQTDGQTQAQQ